MDVLRQLDAWGTTKGRIHGERHFRNHLMEHLSSEIGVDKVYFSDNPHNIYEQNLLTGAA
jgi:hypothetical protein